MNIKTWIVNLARRQDRRQAMIETMKSYKYPYNFFDAVDGTTLEVTNEIARLFTINDYKTAPGVVGCAMSHYRLWQQLCNDLNATHYLILEDDITVTNWPNFTTLSLNEYDLFFLGFTTHHRPMGSTCVKTFDTTTKQSYIGGTFAYIISRSGAAQILARIATVGIPHGIDYFMVNCVDTLSIGYIEPHLIVSPWIRNGLVVNSDICTNARLDTDVQHFTMAIDLFPYWQFYPGIDHKDDDICFIRPTPSVNQIFKATLDNSDIKAFNTLGFCKNPHSIVPTQSPFYTASSGLWVKKTWRIMVTCNWCDPEALLSELQAMSQHFVNLKYKLVTQYPADFHLVLNYPWGPAPKSNTTLIYHLEPSGINTTNMVGSKTWGVWAQPSAHDFFHVCTPHEHRFTPAFWQLTHITPEPLIGQRKNHINIILSQKYNDPGQKFRVDFIRYLEQQNDPDIHINVYGRENYHCLHSWRGPVTEAKEYYITGVNYYLSIENNREEYYITEKFWEPILCETLPIYFGCTNIDKLLPSTTGLITLGDNFSDNLLILKQLVTTHGRDARYDWIRTIKDWVFSTHNIFSQIERQITYCDA